MNGRCNYKKSYKGQSDRLSLGIVNDNRDKNQLHFLLTIYMQFLYQGWNTTRTLFRGKLKRKRMVPNSQCFRF